MPDDIDTEDARSEDTESEKESDDDDDNDDGRDKGSDGYESFNEIQSREEEDYSDPESERTISWLRAQREARRQEDIRQKLEQQKRNIADEDRRREKAADEAK